MGYAPVDQLMQDPSFLSGLSLLGGQTRNIGTNLLGAQQAIQQNQQLQQQQQIRAQQMQQAQQRSAFDPNQYIQPSGQIDRAALLGGMLKNGFDPSHLAPMLSALSVRRDLVPMGTNGLYDPNTGQTIAPSKDPNVNPTVAGLQQLITTRDKLAQANPDDPNLQIYDSMIKHVTGSDKSPMGKAPAGYAWGAPDENGNATLQTIPNGPADVAAQARSDAAQARKDALDQMAAASHARQTDNITQRFSNQMKSSGIPDMQSALGDLEGVMAKYKNGEVPGIGRVQGALPLAMLSPEGQQVRQALERVKNIQIHTLSGSQTSAQEIQRNQNQLGQTFLAPESAIRTGMQGLRSQLNSEMQNASAGIPDDAYNAYVERGGIELPRSGGSGGGAPAAAKAPSIDKNAAIQELRRRGLIK